jgi:hypothetical protein
MNEDQGHGQPTASAMQAFPEADGFIGRSGVIRRIMARLGAERPQSVAIIGGRGSGKTSLLRHLADSTVAARHLGDCSSFVLVSISAGGEEGRDPGRLLDSLASRIGVPEARATSPYEAIRVHIEGLHAAGKRVVVFLDDFHCVTGNEVFPLEFFSFLRSMANNYNLAYVTTSLLELQTLCVAKEIQESPFFNIFTNMHIGPLAADEAALLFERASGFGAVEAATVSAWCGGHPYLLKIAADLAREGILLPGAQPADLAAVVLPSLVPFFEELVSPLPPSAFRLLQVVAKRRAPPPSEAHVLAPLIKQGLLLEGTDCLAPYSPAFGLFLERHLSARAFTGASCR